MEVVKKVFHVMAKSENTNSFGLRQLVLLSKDGSVYKACFNYLNEKAVNQVIIGDCYINSEGKEINASFAGGELVEKQPDATKELLDLVFN